MWFGARFDHAMLVTPAGVLKELTGCSGSLMLHSVRRPCSCAEVSLQLWPTANMHGAACKQACAYSHPLEDALYLWCDAWSTGWQSVLD